MLQASSFIFVHKKRSLCQLLLLYARAQTTQFLLPLRGNPLLCVIIRTYGRQTITAGLCPIFSIRKVVKMVQFVSFSEFEDGLFIVRHYIVQGNTDIFEKYSTPVREAGRQHVPAGERDVKVAVVEE